MKIKYPTLILLLLTLRFNAALSQPTLNLGLSSSSLYTTESNKKEGLTFGVSKNWPLHNSFFISGSMLLTQKSSSLTSIKRINSYLGNFGDYQINVDLQYLETILLLSYFLPSTNNIIALHLGPSFVLETEDNSQVTNSQQYTENAVQNGEGHDYTWAEDPPSILSNSGLCINLGTSFFANIFEIRVLYSRHLSEIYWINKARKINFHEKLHDIKFYIGVKL